MLATLAGLAVAGAPYTNTAQLAPTLTLNWNVVGSRVDFEAVLKLQRWWDGGGGGRGPFLRLFVFGAALCTPFGCLGARQKAGELACEWVCV